MSYEKIKQASLTLFAQKGFEGTTIKDIAAQSGLKPSSIYSHITSKEELFVIIWKECLKNSGKSVEKINNYVSNSKEDYDAQEILQQYQSTIIKHFVKNKEEYLFLRQTTYFAKIKEELNDNTFTNFMINQNTVNFFKGFFIKLKQQDRIIDESDESLFYGYIGAIICYLEEKVVYNIPLGDESIHKFWMMFWKGIKK